MKSVLYQGLNKRPTFNNIIGYLKSDQERMKYPDRTVTRIMHHPYHTNLDGQGDLSVSDQIQNIQLEQVRQMKLNNINNNLSEYVHIYSQEDALSNVSERISQREEQLRHKHQRIIDSLHEQVQPSMTHMHVDQSGDAIMQSSSAPADQSGEAIIQSSSAPADQSGEAIIQSSSAPDEDIVMHTGAASSTAPAASSTDPELNFSIPKIFVNKL